MTIREMQREAHDCAVAKGWHETQRNPLEMIALVHAELSEAVEAYRVGNMASGVKGNFGEELADAVIRIGDMAEAMDIDLQAEVDAKMTYNWGRPYRHGGKLA